MGETRGIGLLGGVETVADKENKAPFDPALKVGPRINNACIESGLILRARGDAITICPPLIINEAQVHELFDKLSAALDKIAGELGR